MSGERATKYPVRVYRRGPAGRDAVARAGIETLEQRRLLSTTVGFEDAPIGRLEDVPYESSGFRFESLYSHGQGANPPDVFGTPQGYESKVLHPADWGDQVRVTRTDGQSFSIESFDYAAGRWGEAMDFRVVGVFEDGSMQIVTAGSDSKSLSTLDLDWTGLERLHIKFAGGENNAYGAVDNFVFATDDDDGAPTSTGFDEEGLVHLTFAGENWNEIDFAVELGDGRFYAFGRGGATDNELPLYNEPPVPVAADDYIARLLPDGSLDESFGDDGVRRWDELDLPAYEEVRSVRMTDEGKIRLSIPGYVIQLNADLTRDTSFGPDGMRESGPKTGPRIEDGYLRIYDENGNVIDETLLPPEYETGELTFGPIATDADGRYYLGFSKKAADTGGPPQTIPGNGIIRLTPDLSLDTSYGNDGFVIHYAGGSPLRLSGVYATEDGRSFLIVRGPDNLTGLYYHDADGALIKYIDNPQGSNSYWASGSSLFRLQFHDDGGFTVVGHSAHSGYSPLDNNQSYTSFGVVRYTAEGERAYEYENNSLYFGTGTEPVFFNDAYFLPDEDLLAFGYDDLFNVDGQAVQDYRRVASLRVIDIDEEPATRTVVDFEDLAAGELGSNSYTNDGFLFANLGVGGGGWGDGLSIYDESDGYASNVLHPENWSSTIRVERVDGQPFTLVSFDYGASVWGDSGDFTLLGQYTEYQGQPMSRAFDGTKSLKAFDRTHGSLLSVTINFEGGDNNAFGALDNFVFYTFGDDEPDTSTVDFESATGPLGPSWDSGQGLTFINDGPGSENLVLNGPTHGFASQTLSTQNWGRSIDLFRTGGGSFDLHRFDYASNRWGDTGDFVLTGIFADGSSRSLERTFSSKALTTLELDWEDLERVEINFAGGANNANGSIDNVVFAV